MRKKRLSIAFLATSILVVGFYLVFDNKKAPATVAYVFGKPIHVMDLHEPTSKAFANLVDQTVIDFLVKRYDLRLVQEDVEAYLRNVSPDSISQDSMRTHRNEISLLRNAMLRVTDGEDPMTIFGEVGNKLGMDAPNWQLVIEKSNPEMIKELELELAKSDKEIVAERVASFEPSFVRLRLQDHACSTSELESMILVSAQSNNTKGIDINTLRKDEGAWQFYCRESYSIWLREVFSENVEVVEDTYRDYLQYSTLTGVEVIPFKPA